MSFALKVPVIISLWLCLAVSASAQILVLGSGPAEQCYQSAKHGDQGSQSAIRNCEYALDNYDISQKDTAATHVNVGVLYMRRQDNKNAQKHYEEALRIRPAMAEIYINYGASLIQVGNFEEALTALNKSIELETIKMPEALYNRSIAYDRLGNFKEAYKDLKQALVVRPDWPLALKALDNYVVTRAPKSN